MPTLSWQDITGQTIVVKFDVVSSMTHEDTVSITDHPVEKGVSITDHAKDEPTSVLVEGYISNIPMPGIDGVSTESQEISAEFGTPRGTQSVPLDIPQPPIALSPTGLLQAGIGAIGRAISGAPKATLWGPFKKARQDIRASMLQHSGSRNRPKEIYELLLQAKTDHALMTVHSPIRDHEDLLIQRLAVPRGLEDGQAVKFQIDLRQIKVANSETVSAPIPVEARGASKANAGAQAKQDKDDEDGRYESTLSKIFY